MSNIQININIEQSNWHQLKWNDVRSVLPHSKSHLTLLFIKAVREFRMYWYIYWIIETIFHRFVWIHCQIIKLIEKPNFMPHATRHSLIESKNVVGRAIDHSFFPRMFIALVLTFIEVIRLIEHNWLQSCATHKLSSYCWYQTRSI